MEDIDTDTFNPGVHENNNPLSVDEENESTFLLRQNAHGKNQLEI